MWGLKPSKVIHTVYTGAVPPPTYDITPVNNAWGQVDLGFLNSGVLYDLKAEIIVYHPTKGTAKLSVDGQSKAK